MERKQIYDLKGKQRYFNFPFQLEEIGWMPHHIHEHVNTVIHGCYVCLSSNSESISEVIVNGNPTESQPSEFSHFSVLLPGTKLHTIRASYHDELFFHYPAGCVEPLLKFFGAQNDCGTNFYFSFFPISQLQQIRKELINIDTPGSVDRLDQLAIQLFTEIILFHCTVQKQGMHNQMKLHSIAEELVRHQNTELDTLLRTYGFSERTFYREWRKLFNVSPKEYLIQRRLDAACTLLTSTELSPAEIADHCGFGSVVYLYQLFRKKLDTTPLTYRNLKKNKVFPEKT